jgi:hypothetical protein
MIVLFGSHRGGLEALRSDRQPASPDDIRGAAFMM